MRPMIRLWVAVWSSFAACSLAQDVSANRCSELVGFVERHELAGAVALVANREQILSIQSVGYSNIESSKNMHDDSVFWIASQTKPMTAALVMTLVDEGRIALEDPVEKYLPEFRGQMVTIEKDEEHALLRKPSHPITIRELLSHMSGLPFQSAIERPTLDGLPLAVAVKSYAMTPLETEPGTRYKYSNAGINTAARIVEVVSGLSYEQILQERLLKPLGMHDTTFWPTEEQAARLAQSYRPNASKDGLESLLIGQLTYPLTAKDRRFPMPAGGLFSTARDVAAFCQMMLGRGEYRGKRLLSEKSVVEMTRRQTPDSVKESYGLGFTVGRETYGHGGAFATNMEVSPERNLVTVWMVQHSGFAGNGGQAQGTFKKWATEQWAK